MNLSIKLLLLGTVLSCSIQKPGAQTSIQVQVNAGASTGSIAPLWGDHYEMHLLYGQGGNPFYEGPHQSIINDPAFVPAMQQLRPRFIRVSIGRADSPPDTNYYSTNTSILRQLPCEFYRGGNSMAEAEDDSNYRFDYLDSLLQTVYDIGAEPFLSLDYMPFTLSSDTTPTPPNPFIHYLAFNNSIRNAPPADNAVFGRVFYKLIKHCYEQFGTRYFEFWNEPDQYSLFFWSGTAQQLYEAYAALADQINADPALSPNIQFGGCSFAFGVLFNTFPIDFFQRIQLNNTRMDFISFHPYSDQGGGYDGERVAIADQWRLNYKPGATLVNAEWGRLDANALDPDYGLWGDLDYGLARAKAWIDMLDRRVTMAHQAVLFDDDGSNDSFESLGMFQVDPLRPKPSAYVVYNMNKFNDTPHRLQVSTDAGHAALAGINDSQDRIVIALPADKPLAAENTVQLVVSNLPWGAAQFYAYRYELTESSLDEGVVFNLTHSTSASGATFIDNLTYAADGNSGRLILWELSLNPVSGLPADFPELPAFVAFPNPANGQVQLKWDGVVDGQVSIRVFNSTGQLVLARDIHKVENTIETLDLSAMAPGIYLVHVLADGWKPATRRVVVSD